MTTEIFENHRKDLEDARAVGLDADTVLPRLAIPGGVYRSYIWDKHWLLGKATWEELRAAFMISWQSPLPVSLSHFPHQGIAQRMQEVRQLEAAGLPFARQFAAEMDSIDFADKTPTSTLAYLFRQIHEAVSEDVPYFLETIADLLQNKLVLHSGKQTYRITELEFYYWQRSHADMYVHKEPEQREMGQWFFNNADCLDLTFGSTTLNYYGGVLLRGLQRLPVPEAETSYVFGPRNVLRELIANVGGAFGGMPRGLFLEDAPTNAFHPQLPWRIRRFGLRQKPDDDHADFLNRRYRFLVDANYLSGLKDRGNIVKQLGLSREEAKAILNYYPAGV